MSCSADAASQQPLANLANQTPVQHTTECGASHDHSRPCICPWAGWGVGGVGEEGCASGPCQVYVDLDLDLRQEDVPARAMHIVV